MKTLAKVLFVFLLTLPTILSAQTKMDKLYQKYALEKGFSAVRFTPEMFKMIAAANLDSLMTTSEKNEIMNQLEDINSIQILTYTANQENPLDFNKIIEKNFSKSEYKLIFEAIENGGAFEVRARTAGNDDAKLDEIVMIAKDKNSTTLIDIDGIVELANLKKLINAYQQKKTSELIK